MEEILRRARRGDTDAALELIGAHEAQMYRLAYVYVKNEADALDVVQEASFRAFRKIRTLKDPRYLRTWLMRITINCAIDRLRSEKRAAVVEDLPVPLSGESALVDRITLENLMQMLTADEKQAVMLRFYADLSLREIAHELRRPEGTAKTILYRALKKLRIKAEEEGFNE